MRQVSTARSACRSRSPRSTSTTRSALVVLVLLAAGCGGDGSTKHDALERALLKTSVSFCDGDCRHYKMADARCGARSVSIDGRRWRRCLTIYEDGGPREYVCAARTEDKIGYIVREKGDCRRR